MRLFAPLIVLALATPALAQDFSGSWDVTGTDPARGPYKGFAIVTKTPQGYSVSRQVEIQQRLPDGRAIVLAWHGVGRNEQGGLRVEVSLARQDFIVSAGGLTRTAADKQPLLVSGLLLPPASSTQRLEGRLQTSEVWTRGTTTTAIPKRVRRVDPANPSGWLLRVGQLVFKSYAQTPWVAPYAQRPEFKAGVMGEVADETGKAFLRANPDKVLLIEKVLDEISLAEERLRADAFRWKLSEKARGWDGSFVADHVDPLTGMLGGNLNGTRIVHGDSALHQGVWVASQAWRYEVTGEPEALANVEKGVGAIIAMIDAPGNPAEFARAVNDTRTADPNWTKSTTLPGVSYLPGGNNDMMHGVDYGLAAAELVLPAGHPFLPEMGKRAKSLVENSKVARRGKHELVLLGVAARLTGDSSMKSRYRRQLIWNPLELFWLLRGEGITDVQEINGRSGPHLATCTFAKIAMLGHKNPSWLERLWREAARRGSRAAWDGSKLKRSGALSIAAGAAGRQDAAAMARNILAEVPYPHILGTARIDHTIDPAFCLSPWPALPWKLDWTRNPGRTQALHCYPLFEISETDNYWKEGPFRPYEGSQSAVRWSRQDYLHLYWLGRREGVIAAGD